MIQREAKKIPALIKQAAIFYTFTCLTIGIFSRLKLFRVFVKEIRKTGIDIILIGDSHAIVTLFKMLKCDALKK